MYVINRFANRLSFVIEVYLANHKISSVTVLYCFMKTASFKPKMFRNGSQLFVFCWQCKLPNHRKDITHRICRQRYVNHFARRFQESHVKRRIVCEKRACTNEFDESINGFIFWYASLLQLFYVNTVNTQSCRFYYAMWWWLNVNTLCINCFSCQSVVFYRSNLKYFMTLLRWQARSLCIENYVALIFRKLWYIGLNGWIYVNGRGRYNFHLKSGGWYNMMWICFFDSLLVQ